MKTTRWTMGAAVAAALAMGAAVAGCARPELLHETPVVAAFLYVDEAGNAIGEGTPDTALVFKVAPSGPAAVIAPDGSDVTWGEFRLATGTAAVTCERDGTAIALDLEGLIPDGVYTAWLLFFGEPGFVAAGFGAFESFAPAGAGDGSDAVLVADAAGRATLDSFVPPIPVAYALDETPETMPECLLDAYEVHVMVAYHIDGQTYGNFPGAEEVVAEQLGFVIAEGDALAL